MGRGASLVKAGGDGKLSFTGALTQQIMSERPPREDAEWQAAEVARENAKSNRTTARRSCCKRSHPAMRVPSPRGIECRGRTIVLCVGGRA